MFGDYQTIKGVVFPTSIGPSDKYMVYPYDHRREDGSTHESDRVLIRVRRKKGVVEVYAVREANHIYGIYTVHLPRIGASIPANVKSASRFGFELSQALRNCVEAFSQSERIV